MIVYLFVEPCVTKGEQAFAIRERNTGLAWGFAYKYEQSANRILSVLQGYMTEEKLSLTHYWVKQPRLLSYSR